MKIVEAENRTSLLIERLVEVWNSSVRATHLFLSCDEIDNIRPYVKQALREVPFLIVEDYEHPLPVAFMGIDGQKLEMLFVSNAYRNKGIGKKLLHFGIERFSVNDLTVNEQNPVAMGFYEHMGFHVYKRTDLDEQGNPYPLLYMKR